MSALRILMVTQYFDPEPFRVNDLVSGLLEHGHHVTVLTGMPNYPEGSFYPGYNGITPATGYFQGAKVIRVPMVSRGRSKNWRLALNYLSFALSASVLGIFRCRGRFDLIFVFQPSPITVALPALVLSWWQRVPLMLWIQDLWPETLQAMGQGRLALHIGRHLADLIHRRCDRLLVQSEAFVQPLRQSGIAANRICFLPNWAEDLYQDQACPANLGIEHGKKVFKLMFAGSIGSAQSFETIITAAHALRHRSDILWLIVGDGLMRPHLESEISRLNLQDTVKLLGRHPPETMPGFFAAADALLVTLRPEPVFALTVPSKIQSYLAAGRPIIGALDGEGARIIEAAGSGFSCPAGNAEALTATVERMAGLPPEELAAMGKRGSDYFRTHFQRGMLIARLEHWMHELVKSRKNGHADSDPRR